jgi:hypothetical protein
MKIIASLYFFFTYLFAVAIAAAHDCIVYSGLPKFTYALGAATLPSDLWVPQIWKETMMERRLNLPHFLNSGVIITSPEVKEIAAGPGIDANIPFLIEPDHADQVQVTNANPTVNAISSGLQRAAILNRVSTLGAQALAAATSGADPVKGIMDSILGLRMRQRATALHSALTGIFGLGAAPAAATGAFRALRLDNFVEVTADITANHLIDGDMILDAVGLMGDAKLRLDGGAILMHSDIEKALSKQDQITEVRNSEGKLVMKAYKGMEVVMDDRLFRLGTGTGTPKVYFTFICARGSIVLDEKDQVFTDKAGEVAAVQVSDTDVAGNVVAIYDRTRYVIHPQGAKWSPTTDNQPAFSANGGTARNADLADPADWALAFADVRNVSIVCLRTNG